MCSKYPEKRIFGHRRSKENTTEQERKKPIFNFFKTPFNANIMIYFNNYKELFDY